MEEKILKIVVFCFFGNLGKVFFAFDKMDLGSLPFFMELFEIAFVMCIKCK